MSPGTLKRLAALLVLLALVWTGWTLRLRRPKDRRLWPQARSASRLSIGRTVLSRSSGTWRLEAPFPFPADAPAVDGLLEKLSKVRVSEPLSRNPERHSLFGVTESSAIRVQGPGLDVFIGSAGADWDAFFVRRAGEDAVLEARGMGRFELEGEAQGWAERVLFALAPARKPEIEVASRGRRVSLKPEDGRWPKNAEAVVTALSRLEADSILPDASAHPFVLNGLKRPELRVAVHYPQLDAGGPPAKDFILECGPRKAEFDHPCRKQGVDGFIYELKPHRLQAFYDLLKK
ncbi:MAG: DUF4340 domain-containing protein [Elusimicrobiota bacterium]